MGVPTEALEHVGVSPHKHEGANVLAVVSQKGGVGKTTTVVNVGACLAAQGYRTLIVDLDASYNATHALGVEPPDAAPMVGHFLRQQAAFDEVVTVPYPEALPSLNLLPSREDLTETEAWLRLQRGGEHRLRLALEPLRGRYDYILLDCPPSFSLLMVNAMCAATQYLVPCYAEQFSTEGLHQMQQTVAEVRQFLGRDPEFLGVLVTNFDRRLGIHRQVEAKLRETLGEKVLAATIGTNSRLKEAQALGLPVRLYDKNARSAHAYESATEELLLRIRRGPHEE